MDIQDYDALVATVRGRLPELTPAQLTDLGIAVRAEQERRQWPLTSATPLQSGAAAVTVGVAPHIFERWRTTRITVNQSWLECHTPWFCSQCGAECLRVRNTPLRRPPQVPETDEPSLRNQELQRRWSALQSP